MIASILSLLAFFWLSFIEALSFSPDFNGTIPSILGVTDFEYPTSIHHLESRYADGIVNTNWHQPWPLTQLPNRETHLIRFCYADQASKDALHCAFHRALDLWKDALGGVPSEETGYNLYFLETYFQGEAQLCYKADSYDAKTGQGLWNWKIAKRQDALVIRYRPIDENGNKPATAATLGFTPEEVIPPWEVKQARHNMQITEPEDEVKIAHELGHVFGLAHEHQRSDRDTFIEYRPENIAGYKEALNTAISDGVYKDEAHQKLTDDSAFCLKYKFRGDAYVKGAGQPGVLQGDPAEGLLDFDFDSIMMYPSDALTDTAACRGDIAKCPIVRRAGKDTSGNSKFEYMPAKQKPSAKDAMFVRKHYPWR